MLEHMVFPTAEQMARDVAVDNERAHWPIKYSVTPNPAARRGLWERLRGQWRLMHGFCPACNSDAPELDSCPICLGYSSGSAGYIYPPLGIIKDAWRRRFNNH